MPKISHIILSWARETAGLDVEIAAKKLQITDGKVVSSVDKLTAYENGQKEPSRAMLLKMAKLYRRPLLTFYLDEPPKIGDRGEDFRILPEESFAGREAFYIDALIREVRACQSTVREALIDEDEDPRLGFVGKNSVAQGISTVAQTIRQALSFDILAYRASASYEEAFKYLRVQAEDVGVFVLLRGNLGSFHTNIGVTAFRGFALSDDIAPFIVINDQDAKAAWSFTLLHELAHIILGQTGISGAYAERQIEKFCNDVASEVLLPEADFESFRLSGATPETIQEEISQFAFSMKISSSHVSYRLFRRGDIKKDFWEKLREYFKEQWHAQRDEEKQKSRQQEGGPSYYVLQRHKLGALVGLVERLTYSGALTTAKAGMLLGVRPIKVHNLFNTGQAA